MKIVLITDFTPTKDNINGPSALCYHLLKELQKDAEIFIFSTNANKVSAPIIESSSKTFHNKLKITPRSLYQKLIIWKKTNKLFSFFYPRNMPSIGRYKLPYKILKQVDNINPNLIIVYPIQLIGVLKQVYKKYTILTIGPDCFNLHNFRMLNNEYTYKIDNINNVLHRISIDSYTEQAAIRYSNYIGLVGLEDCKLFNLKTNSQKAFFFPHPHFAIADKIINLNKKILKVVITGKYDLYTYSDTNLMIKALIKDSSILKDFTFTFIGKKWETIVNKLSPHIKVEHKTWVEDYTEEIKKYDIQILPISIGSGTKGKTLDAIINGLVCIGSYYAFENIAVTPNSSCIIYKTPLDIPNILISIYNNKNQFEEMVSDTKKRIIEYHSPTIGSNIIKSLINNKSNNIIQKNNYFSNI